MKLIFLNVFVLVAGTLSQVIPQQLVGSYSPIDNKPCPKLQELVLGSDGTLLTRHCDKTNSEQIQFGIYYPTENSQLQAITSTGTSYKIQTNPDGKLTVEGQTLQKTLDPEFNINNLAKLLNLFGSFKANLPQPRNECEVIKTLELGNNGQIRRTFCKDKYDDWYTRGFFKVVSFHFSLVRIESTVNGTKFPTEIKFLDSKTITYDDKVNLFRA